MSKLLTEETEGMSRRLALITLYDILRDEDVLKETVGKDPLVDIALARIAAESYTYTHRLEKYLNISELDTDISHAHKSAMLREQKTSLLKEGLQCVDSTTKL